MDFGPLPIVHLGAFLSAELLLIWVIFLCEEYWFGPGASIETSPSVLFEFPIVALGSLLRCPIETVSYAPGPAFVKLKFEERAPFLSNFIAID